MKLENRITYKNEHNVELIIENVYDAIEVINRIKKNGAEFNKSDIFYITWDYNQRVEVDAFDICRYCKNLKSVCIFGGTREQQPEYDYACTKFSGKSIESGAFDENCLGNEFEPNFGI